MSRWGNLPVPPDPPPSGLSSRGTSASRWATFDCYGTLIDWNAGIRGVLGSDELLDRYHEVEPQVEAEDPTLPYREVLAEVSRRLGLADDGALARSLPDWRPFPDVPGALRESRRRGWKLAILSNTDRDFIEASMRQLDVPFDVAIVAGEIGSYKPAHRHWERFFAETGAARERHVHVAASLFHDVAPARELGLTSVWINRLDERADPEPTRELPDLIRLPETLDDLVAA
jgi:2-haloacid dehalogenase